MCFAVETRPYNQGSRLTAYELVYENMPGTLICHNMAAASMQKGLGGRHCRRRGSRSEERGYSE